MKQIYLDYAATTPADPEVVKTMLPYFTQIFGNPSSIYSCGQEAKGTVEEVRAKVAADWEASMASLEAPGVRRVVIRTGVVLSTEGGALPRMLLPFRLFAGGRLGSGRQWFPWSTLPTKWVLSAS